MEFDFEQVVPAGVEQVFAFYENPDNLPRMLVEWGRLRLLHCDTPLRPGGVMWVQEAFFAIPVALGFRCTQCDRPHRLGGEMIHGPFQRFTHLHEFAGCKGGTRVRDRLDVAVPWQFGGEWTLRRLIAPLLRRAFFCRQRELARLARDGQLGGE